MKIYKYLWVGIVWVVSTTLYGQTSKNQWFITANGNLYMPSENSGKGVYPILWYDKETDPSILIGGLGIGVSVLKRYKEKISIKGQANLSKHTYWDEPYTLTEPNGAPFQEFVAGCSDYTVGVMTTAQYFLAKELSLGTGLGGQVLLASFSRLPEDEFLGFEGGFARNRYYKTFMPMWPVELSYTLERLMFNIRYEYAFLNRLKGKLSDFKKDKFSLLTFEIGFRLK